MSFLQGLKGWGYDSLRARFARTGVAGRGDAASSPDEAPYRQPTARHFSREQACRRQTDDRDYESGQEGVRSERHLESGKDVYIDRFFAALHQIKRRDLGGAKTFC